MAQPNQEPSMEDILASIKRIIAEDSEAVGVRPAKARREAISAVSASPLVAPVLEPVPEPEAPAAEEPEAAADHEQQAHEQPAPVEQAMDAPEPVAEVSDVPDVLELTSPMPEAVTAEAPATPAEAPVSFAPAKPAGGLLSGTSAEASRNAFAALSQLQVRSEEGQSNTLEGLVSDMLRPMLKEWLDRELPSLVERLVQTEVRRLANGG